MLSIGSPKQIEWAERIKKEFLDEIQGIVHPKKDELLAYVEEIKSAVTWINQRYLTAEDKIKVFLRMKQNEIQRATEKVEYVDAMNEATMWPETPRIQAPAEIRHSNVTIVVDFPAYDENFVDVMHRQRFFWDEPYWTRAIEIRLTDLTERMVELGYELLRNRFPIRIYDSEIRRRIAGRDFHPEKTLFVDVKDDKFLIHWYKRGKNYYEKAKRISGAKWVEGKFYVPPENYEEVIDFGTVENAVITAEALSLAESVKSKQRNICILKPAKEEQKKEEIVTVPDELKD